MTASFHVWHNSFVSFNSENSPLLLHIFCLIACMYSAKVWTLHAHVWERWNNDSSHEWNRSTYDYSRGTIVHKYLYRKQERARQRSRQRERKSEKVRKREREGEKYNKNDYFERIKCEIMESLNKPCCMSQLLFKYHNNPNNTQNKTNAQLKMAKPNRYKNKNNCVYAGSRNIVIELVIMPYIEWIQKIIAATNKSLAFAFETTHNFFTVFFLLQLFRSKFYK